MLKTIEISDETWEKIKDTVNADEKSFEVNDMQDFVGQKLYIRTVTFHLVGEVTKKIGKLLELRNASWVADSGRFMQAIKEGTLSEVEPVGKAWVNTDAIVDMFPWTHELPKKQI